MKVYYGKAVYNQKEIKAVTNVLKKKPLSFNFQENRDKNDTTWW